MPTDALGVFVCALVLDLGWVISVRLVERQAALMLAAWAVVMQLLSYQSVLLVVHDASLQLTGALGAGAGALLGMVLPERWLRRG